MNDRSPAPLTLMAVHAHPDDECLGTGGVLARYAAEGVRTVLVTATLGEEGEIHDPDLTEEEARPRLAEIRREELRRATEILQVGAQEFLGYRDSGMAGTPANENPASFNKADREEATERLVRLIRRHRPQVLVTYNADGGYGHPDHIQCHKITYRAFDAAGDPARYPDAGPAWQPLKLYATAWSRDHWQALRAELERRGIPWFFEEEDTASAEGKGEERAEAQQALAAAANSEDAAHEPGAAEPQRERRDEDEEWGTPDDAITTFVPVGAYWKQPREALRQHRTQFEPDSRFLSLPDDVAAMMGTTEFFILLRSRVATTWPEDDLFAGMRDGAAVAEAGVAAAASSAGS
jgi:LmbE family N-acetylglucosaminyl deacetylase